MKAIALAAAVLIWGGQASAAPDAVVPVWVASTSFKPAKLKDGEVSVYEGQAVRQDIRFQAATRKVSLRLTNELGASPVSVAKVELRVIQPDGSLGAARRATFGGQDSVTLEPGLVRYTDYVEMAVAAFTDVAIIVQYAGLAEPVAHRAMVRIAPGGETPTSELPTVRGAAIVSAVESLAPPMSCRRVVVALGDSITEGVGSTRDNDWPSRLSRRFQRKRCEVVIVNAGISGNRVLSSGASPALLARLDRDVLTVPGVTDIILVEGINDVRSFEATNLDSEAAAAQLLEGYRQLVVRAHAHGIRVIGGTLTPYKGTKNQTPAGLATVERVNSAIRSGAVFDEAIDFNRAVADPADPQRMRVDFQRGDWLHPNDAGYAAMAAAAPETLFNSPR